MKYTLKSVDKDAVEDTILAANADESTDGIIVYVSANIPLLKSSSPRADSPSPLPKHHPLYDHAYSSSCFPLQYPIFGSRQDQYLQQLVSLPKDVEGLSHQYIFNMYQNIRFLDPATTQRKSILPCTPLAVIKILEYLRIYNTILPYGNRLFGHTICVVNRSEVVGRPLAALLANDGAHVYSVDVSGVQQFTRGQGIRKTKHEVLEMGQASLADFVPKCDVVITGVPGDAYKFPTHLLKDGCVCVNFSTEKVRARVENRKASTLTVTV